MSPLNSAPTARTLARERELLVTYGGRLGPDGLAIGTSGNLSCRSGDLVAITPRGVRYDLLEPEHICVVTREGRPVHAPLAPSSELPMHLAVYERSEARAVVHTHSPYATTLGTLIDELPPIHYLVCLLGGPVRVAPYATPGSPELAESMARALRGRSGVLLGNHGALTVGDTLEAAYSRAVLLEWLAALYYRARLLGEPKLLGPDEVARVGELMQHYLQDPLSSPDQ
jgi:L-fuculose-phosphate aldolase